MLKGLVLIQFQFHVDQYERLFSNFCGFCYSKHSLIFDTSEPQVRISFLNLSQRKEFYTFVVGREHT